MQRNDWLFFRLKTDQARKVTTTAGASTPAASSKDVPAVSFTPLGCSTTDLCLRTEFFAHHRVSINLKFVLKNDDKTIFRTVGCQVINECATSRFRIFGRAKYAVCLKCGAECAKKYADGRDTNGRDVAKDVAR